MNRHDIHDALGYISDKHIAEAAAPKKRSIIPYIGVAAACAVLLICLFLPKPESTGNPPTIQNPDNSYQYAQDGLEEPDTSYRLPPMSSDISLPLEDSPLTDGESSSPTATVPQSPLVQEGDTIPPSALPAVPDDAADTKETDPEDATEVDETDAAEPTVTVSKSLHTNSDPVLKVNGSSLPVLWNDAYDCAQLPLLGILKELGANITWQGRDVVTVLLCGTEYHLNTAKGILTKGGSSINLLSVAPGSGHGSIYQITGNEFIIDSDSVTGFFRTIGVAITVDRDNRLVTIIG